jgi:hypothetical protein
VSGGRCVGQGHGGRAHRGGLSPTRWRMGGSATAFQSGVSALVAVVTLASFCGQRERQKGELRAEMEGREKERTGVAVTRSRGGGGSLTES